MVKGIVTKVKPQLIRKRHVVKVPPTVKVIVNPAKATVAPKEKVVATPPAKRRAGGVVVQPRNPARKKPRRKKGNITYKTRDVSPQTIEKIKKLRNQGVNKSLVIIGNGPSILEVPLEKLKSIQGVEILSVNTPDERIWPSEYWAFFDKTQFRRHKALWDSYDGTIFNSTSIREQKEKSMQFKHMGGVGFSRDLTKGIYIGRSSVYASMQIALWMNFQKVFILGCDMNPEGINGKLHSYGDNPDVEPQARAARFEREAQSYDCAADVLTDEEKERFVFCSDYNEWPFVDRFIRVSHKTVIETISVT